MLIAQHSDPICENPCSEPTHPSFFFDCSVRQGFRIGEGAFCKLAGIHDRRQTRQPTAVYRKADLCPSDDIPSRRRAVFSGRALEHSREKSSNQARKRFAARLFLLWMSPSPSV